MLLDKELKVAPAQSSPLACKEEIEMSYFQRNRNFRV